MAKLATFRIPLRGAKQGTDNYEFLLDDDFFRAMESIDILGGAVKVSLAVRRANEANYFAIHCQGTIQIVCDRCLEPMDYAVEADYDLAVKYGDEYDDSNDGVLIVPEGDNDLDVAPIVYDTVALSIPLQHVHAEGECDEATWQALQAHTAHDLDDEPDEYGTYADEDADADQLDNETNIDPRWAELMKLKDNKLKNK
ncbi:MAG: YceD family protein [Muribaculaceae bacterium]